MTSTFPPDTSPAPRQHRPRGRRQRLTSSGSSLLAQGQPMIWLTGAALVGCLAMVIGLLALVVYQGMATFWPRPLTQVQLRSDRVLLGEVTRWETYLPAIDETIARAPEPARLAWNALPLDTRNTLANLTLPQLRRPDALDPALRLAFTQLHPEARNALELTKLPARRRLYRIGNYELTGEHFAWVSDADIVRETNPPWALLLERLEWGNFYGSPNAFILRTLRPIDEREARLVSLLDFTRAARADLPENAQPHALAAIEALEQRLTATRHESIARFLTQFPQDLAPQLQLILADGKTIAPDQLPPEPSPDANVVEVRQIWTAPDAAWALLNEHHDAVVVRRNEGRDLNKYKIGEINHLQEQARLAVRQQELATGATLLQLVEPMGLLSHETQATRDELARLQSLVHAVGQDLGQHTPAGAAMLVHLHAQIERARDALARQQARHAQWMAQVDAAPPALAQSMRAFLQVRDDATAQTDRVKQRLTQITDENTRYLLDMSTADGKTKAIALDAIVRAVPANRLTTSQALGVYCSRWAEFLTDEPREANSEGGVFPAIFGTVLMTLVMTIIVVPLGVMAALYLREYAKAGPVVSAVRIAVNNLAGVPSIVFGVFGLGFFIYFLGGDILDPLLFADRLPNPTFGKGGLLWASLTLALLTLPVVIVATEEALAAVPNSMREGSYGCGASKWQTIRRIVLPRAMPGIMTGMILAMARGAGEVAPLMLVGAVKLAPELPLDSTVPFLHPERSFMHLGFHIFDLGFQSPNSEAAKPMVYTTTLLLILIVFVLNLAAIWLRSRLRRRFGASQF